MALPGNLEGLAGHGPPKCILLDCRPEPPIIEVSMYAVIQTGGKQYRVAEGDVLRVEQE